MVLKKRLASKDPTLERTFRGHRDGVTSCAFNPSMQQMASGSKDGCVMLWNFKPSLRSYRFVGHKDEVTSVSFHPNGGCFASGSKDSTIRFWLTSMEGKSSLVKAHSSSVTDVSFSRTGSMLVSASVDKTVKLWNFPSQKFRATLSGHKNWVNSARFSSDGRLVASTSDDKSVRVWDVETQSTLHKFYDHDAAPQCAVFHPDGTVLASCAGDRTIKLYDARSNMLIQHYGDAHDGTVNSIAFHPSGDYLISTGDDSSLKIWDLREGMLFYTLHGHEGPTRSAEFSPAGDYFSSASDDEQIMVWKTNFTPDVCRAHKDLRQAATAQQPTSKKSVYDRKPARGAVTRSARPRSAPLAVGGPRSAAAPMLGPAGATPAAKPRPGRAATTSHTLAPLDSDLAQELLAPPDQPGSGGVLKQERHVTFNEDLDVGVFDDEGVHKVTRQGAGFSGGGGGTPARPKTAHGRSFQPGQVQATTYDYDDLMAKYDELSGRGVLHGGAGEGASTSEPVSPPGVHSGDAYDEVMVLVDSNSDVAEPSGGLKAYGVYPDSRKAVVPAAAPRARYGRENDGLMEQQEKLALSVSHIVGQLEVLTKTMSLMEERLTMNEDRVSNSLPRA